MSLRKTRNFLRLYRDVSTEIYANQIYNRHILIGKRAFDKTINALRIAMNRISEIITDVEEDWNFMIFIISNANSCFTRKCCIF